MNKRKGLLRILGAAGAAIFFLGLIATPVYAKKGGGAPAGFEHGEKKGWGEGKEPPGWNHGEKKGWDGKETPPGLTSEDE